MREVKIGRQEHTKVVCLDDPGPGGTCHEYQVLSTKTEIPFAEIKFQKGSVKENGINGCHNEDLIAIVIDRISGFQAGHFPCKENEMALQKLNDALMCLRERTNWRKERGIEGISKP